MGVPLNFAIMRHPANWLKVWLMVLIAAVAVDIAFHFYETGENENAS